MDQSRRRAPAARDRVSRPRRSEIVKAPWTKAVLLTRRERRKTPDDSPAGRRATSTCNAPPRLPHRHRVVPRQFLARGNLPHRMQHGSLPRPARSKAKIRFTTVVQVVIHLGRGVVITQPQVMVHLHRPMTRPVHLVICQENPAHRQNRLARRDLARGKEPLPRDAALSNLHPAPAVHWRPPCSPQPNLMRLTMCHDPNPNSRS